MLTAALTGVVLPKVELFGALKGVIESFPLNRGDFYANIGPPISCLGYFGEKPRFF